MAKRARSKGAGRGKRGKAAIGSADAACVGAALPKIDALEDVPAFTDVRPSDEQRAAFEAFCSAAETPGEMHLGCVVRLDRGFPLVVTAERMLRAEHAVGFAKQDKEKGDGLLPAVGDWVALRLAPGTIWALSSAFAAPHGVRAVAWEKSRRAAGSVRERGRDSCRSATWRRRGAAWAYRSLARARGRLWRRADRGAHQGGSLL